MYGKIKKINIDILAQNFFGSQFICGGARKKIWDKKSMLNFSRQAHNAKVTDCHALFRILRFFELGCFLGRNIDLGGSFPTHDSKFGQFRDSKNFAGLQNYFGIFQKCLNVFFFSDSEKHYFSLLRIICQSLLYLYHVKSCHPRPVLKRTEVRNELLIGDL